MTCIAFDGRILAADGLSVCSDQINSTEVNKLYRCEHPLFGPLVIGMAGRQLAIPRFITKIERYGFDFDTPPIEPEAFGIAVSRDGQAWDCTDEGMWHPITGYAAQGSGGLLALAALRDGANAVEAVRYASRHITSCGGTIRAYDPKSNVIAVLR